MPLGEFDLIRRYFTRPSSRAALGIGDDAALLPISAGKLLAVSTDMLVSGRHFFSDADPYLLGRKSLAVNLSDMAAMGALPRWATLSLALPEANETWLTPFAKGFFSMADEYDVELVGGDTTRGPLNICVQIMGETNGDAALRRDGAKVGDTIWISGELGGAALALCHLQNKLSLPIDAFARCAPRLHDPSPRVALGLALQGIADSAIDISDGLIGDLGHILQRSGVAAEIHLHDVPCAKDLLPHIAQPWGQQALLTGGDDYELCFTAAPEQTRAIEQISQRIGLTLTPVGKVIAGTGLVVHDPRGVPLDLNYASFDHFR
jgi:thiamine-monophosphate kinase